MNARLCDLDKLQEEINILEQEVHNLTTESEKLSHDFAVLEEETELILHKVDMFCLMCSTRDTLKCFLCTLYKLVVDK